MKREHVIEMFSRLREFNPKPSTELDYSSPFELLVAVILSAQATDVGVNKATRRLFPVANTPQAMLELGEEALKKHIATIGLFNAKAKNGPTRPVSGNTSSGASAGPPAIRGQASDAS